MLFYAFTIDGNSVLNVKFSFDNLPKDYDKELKKAGMVDTLLAEIDKNGFVKSK